MNTYLVISYIPTRQGWLAPIPEKYVVEDVESTDLDTLVAGVHVPQGGWVKVIREECVTVVKAKTVNEVV